MRKAFRDNVAKQNCADKPAVLWQLGIDFPGRKGYDFVVVHETEKMLRKVAGDLEHGVW